MRILILGASGMLGAAAMVRFGQLGYETQALSRAQFDIAHDPIDGLRGEIKRSDAVVNCAGRRIARECHFPAEHRPALQSD
jgi:dTDP-4-dehydrorhamnose reductase